jgi:hypothetical protein
MTLRAIDGAQNKFIRLEAAAEGVIAEREAEMDVIAVDTAVSGNPDAAGPRCALRRQAPTIRLQRYRHPPGLGSLADGPRRPADGPRRTDPGDLNSSPVVIVPNPC